MRYNVAMKGKLGIKAYIALILVALGVVIVLQNTDIVEVKLLFWRLSVSRVILLAGTAAFGFVVGVLSVMEIMRRKDKAQ